MIFNNSNTNKMRTILFRGQKADTKEWIFGDLIQLEKDFKKVVEILDWSKVDNKKKSKSDLTVNQETVGQFTGLTDKNGVEIYEHDIIKFLIDNEKYVVQFEEGAFCLVSNSVCGIISMYDFENLEYEVIGNIHETPELL